MNSAFDPTQQKKKLEDALESFVQRLEGDRNILAAVLVGSFADEVLWHKETIHLWIIEDDGVSRRLKSDGNDERIFRTLLEGEVTFHAEIIPRSRFKRMVEGASRTAFSCNFFAHRHIVHCKDASIDSWFRKANEVATRDQKLELLATASWVMHAAHHARKAWERGPGPFHLAETLLWAAHGLAATEVIARGEVTEGELIRRAMELDPALFRTIYHEVLSKAGDAPTLSVALEAVESLLDRKGEGFAEPILAFLRKERRPVPFSEVADQFAHTQLYPWHLEGVCEWLARRGTIQKLSAPFRLTKKSRVDVEEPAYGIDI